MTKRKEERGPPSPAKASTGRKTMHGDSMPSIRRIQADLRRFLSAIFQPNDIVEVRCLPSKESSWHQPKDLVNKANRLLGPNRDGENIYFGANPRKKIGGRSAKDVALARCLFVDIENTTIENASQLIREAGLPKPTASLNSGHGVHLYWRLKKTLKDLSAWRARQKALIAALKSDPKVHDAPRIMRLPGFMNVKDEPAVPCKLVACDARCKYDISAFPGPQPGKTAGVSDKRPATNEQTERERNPNALTLAKAYARKWQGVRKGDPGRNNSAEQHAADLTHDFALSDEEAWPILLGWNAKNLPPLDEAELRQCLGSGRKYGKNPIGCKLNDSSSIPYRETEQGLVWNKPTQDGPLCTRLTTFTAHVVADMIQDDGVETRRNLEIEASLNGKSHCFLVPASRFPAMNWPMEHLGVGAILYPGIMTKEHARTAIQMLSGEVPQRRVFTHTGWRKIDSTFVYLHGGGAVGPIGPVTDIQVQLNGSLREFILPDPPTGEVLRDAVRASLAILDLGPGRITVPILGATYRAVLGPTDLSVHLSGRTGVFKTELGVLPQRHFGIGFNSRNAPGSWLSTGNSIEVLAFEAKDALLLVDDFAPSGTSQDVARLHREAARIFRAQGNRSGRGRLRSDGSLRPVKAPRGLILSTGEDTPRGQSVRARVFLIELREGDIPSEALTQCQADADAGLYAQAMAGFLRWLACRYEEVRAHLPEEIIRLRQEATQSGQHRRTPDIVANVALGLRYLFEFSKEAGALQESEASDLWRQSWAALGEAASEQAGHLAASEPTVRFFELLSAAIASGRAHVAGPSGEPPEVPGDLGRPAAWGWWSNDNESFGRAGWQPKGPRVGWIEGDDLFLNSPAAYEVAQKMAGAVGDGIAVSEQTLKKRLKDKGLLASTEPERGRLTVRKTLEGTRREVLHLRAKALMPREPSQSSQATRYTDMETRNGDLRDSSWDGTRTESEKPPQGNGPVETLERSSGTNGAVGPARSEDTP